MRSQALLLLCFSFLLALNAQAQAGPQLTVEHWFPEHPTSEFFPGKPVPVVVGVRNVGSSAFNVTAIGATLNNPFNASINLFNFSTQSYFQPLPAGDEASLEYVVYFPYNLPPREFNLKINLFLTVDDTMLSHMLYNETISIIEEAKWFDTELIGLWLVLAAILGLGAWFATEYLKNLNFVKKAAKKNKKGAAAKDAAPADDWLKGTYYDQQKKKAASAAAAKADKKAE